MKTHEIANVLNALATALRSAPDQELSEFGRMRPAPKRKLKDSDVPLALSTLLALSELDKSQWLKVINEFNFPIEIRPRDASRDILGKILAHLAQNPEARQRLSLAAQGNRNETSPELMKALSFLLKS
jgi:hypothetical protein